MAVIAATATAAGVARPSAVPVGDDSAAEDGFLYEDEPPVPDYAQVARVLSGIGNERLAFRPNLYVEMAEAVLNLPSGGKARARLSALGVGIESIRAAGGLGALRVVTEDGYFVPADQGDSQAAGALVLPVFEDGTLTDLIAFNPDSPARFFVRTKLAKALGMWHADHARDNTTLWPSHGEVHPSLPLFPDPLSWLQGGCEGTCVLNSAWLAHTLVNIRSVTATSEHHAATLHKALTWPGAPEIFFHQKKKRETA